MAAPNLEKLYELCDVIDAAKDKTQCQTEYNLILNGTKGGVNEKKFASQLIVRYFSHFAELRDQALDAMFGLCEDDDVNIRKAVIKELPALCKEDGKHISKIADVLVQLFQTEDAQEQHLVNTALIAVLAGHPKDTITTLFGHILNPDVELIRERAVKFIGFKLKTLPESVLTKEIEEFVIQESKKALQECSGDEFLWLMHMLSQMKSLQTVQGRQFLLDIVTEQADLDKAFDPQDPDRVDQIMQCVKQATPFMSKNVHSTKFITFLIDKAIPFLPKITGDHADNTRLELVRLLADLSNYCGTDLPEPNDKIDVIEKALLNYLPLPPSESGASGQAENGAGGDLDEPKYKFSEIESLIYALHQFGRRWPQHLSSAEKEESFKELKKRLTFLARIIQVYSSKLSQALAKTPKEDLKSDENRLKQMGLKTTSNINVLVKDLLRTPLSYKATVCLSWKTPEQKPAVAEKRPAEKSETPSSQPKQFRKNVSIYQPPSGKFSEKAGTFQGSEDNNNGNGNATGSGFRGRGRGRGGAVGGGGGQFRGGQQRGRGGGGGDRGRYKWTRGGATR